MTYEPAPRELRIEVQALRPGRGVYAMQGLLQGVVDAPAGSVHVTVGLAIPTKKEEPEPATLHVHFPTRDHPDGIGYAIDMTDFMESIVRAYFRERPRDAPAEDTE